MFAFRDVDILKFDLYAESTILIVAGRRAAFTGGCRGEWLAIENRGM